MFFSNSWENVYDLCWMPISIKRNTIALRYGIDTRLGTAHRTRINSSVVLLTFKPLSAEKEFNILRHKSLYAEFLYAKSVFNSATETNENILVIL